MLSLVTNVEVERGGEEQDDVAEFSSTAVRKQTLPTTEQLSTEDSLRQSEPDDLPRNGCSAHWTCR